jgi:hypothetical protein
MPHYRPSPVLLVLTMVNLPVVARIGMVFLSAVVPISLSLAVVVSLPTLDLGYAHTYEWGITPAVLP